MNRDDILWTLEDAIDIESQDVLFQHLENSDQIKGLIYLPDELKRESPKHITTIRNKNFERVSFTRTHISGIIFRNCTFHHCLFIGTKISNCEFHDCRFISTNTHKILISRTYINPQSFQECLNEKKYQNIGLHLYRVLLKNYRDENQFVLARDAQFLFLQWQRYQDAFYVSQLWKNLRSKKQITDVIGMSASYIGRWVWEKFFGSGIRILPFIWTTLGVVVLLSAINFGFREQFGIMHGNIPITQCVDAFYFTTISLTTLGYGDLVPTTSIGRIFAALQSVLGFFLLGLLASILYRRVSQ